MKNKIDKKLISKKLLNKKLLLWINQFSILYNLLIFLKKRLYSNFINFPSNLFFILLLPLLGYILDKKNFIYNNSNSEFFFKKTLPGLNNFNMLMSSNLNWETFNYTEYFKKINWNKLKKINYFDNSIFICFNSNLYNRNYYIGIYNININRNQFSSTKLLKKIHTNNIEKNKKLNKYFISGRFFNKFFKFSIDNQKKHLIVNKYNLNKLVLTNIILKKNFEKFKQWQDFFYELDYIPIKLNNIFYTSIQNVNYNLKLTNLNSFYNYENKEKYINKNNKIEPLFNNLFYYSINNKFNYSTNINKNSIFLKNNKLKYEKFNTIIEKQNIKLNSEIVTKKINNNLFNFRFFQYKIYNNFFLLKYFLNNQINNFNYNQTNLKNTFNLLLTKDYYINNKYKSKLLRENNNKFINYIQNQNEPNWRNLLRKDLKNLGNTKTEKFFNIDKIKNQFLNITNYQNKTNNLIFSNLDNNKKENNSLFFFKNTIKNPISLYNRENKNLVIKLKNKDFIKTSDKNKLYEFNINNKKSSFIPYFERELFYYLNNLIKSNKVLDLKKYSDQILFFIFKNYNLKNSLDKTGVININEKNNSIQKIDFIKDRINEANSDLLKRKMSGYLYPDNKKTYLLFINKLNLFNNSFIKIQGQKNLIYKYFKKFYNNLFFLYHKKNLINIEQINYSNKNKYFYLKDKSNLIKTKFFFGSATMDFGLNFQYDKSLNIKLKKENIKIKYKPNLNLIYNKRKLDAKLPFSCGYPIKDEFLFNNLYYNSLLFNKKNYYIFDSHQYNKINLPYINNKLLEMNDYNEIFLFPISYKSHFEYNINYNILNFYYSNIINNFKNLFNSDLYEFVTFQQFSLLIQFIFLFIFLQLINNLKDNYGQSFLIAFKNFFNNFEFDALNNLKIKVGKTVNLKKTKFNNLVGGKFFLQNFNQTILLLKNSKYGFQSNLNIQKPYFEFHLVSKNKKFFIDSKTKKYKNLFVILNKKQKNFLFNFIYNPFNLLIFTDNLTNINNKLFIKNLKNIINIKGFLLVGPPGTGKTFLVKALSGEADVPILLESGEKLSKLNVQNETISENAKGALQLKNLFNRAKKLSPCILFLDEIDNVGKNRKDVLIDYNKQKVKNYSTTNSLDFLLNKTKKKNYFTKLKKKTNLNLQNTHFINLKKKINTNNTDYNELNSKSLSMLTQLLCELDGLKNRCDLVIIGATNRPKILDPALIRPGRLNKIIYIDLPGKKKRFELLKFYSKNKINKNTNINWDFFSNQTIGLSAAHLSSSINIALLKTIYNLKFEKKLLGFNKIKDNNLNSLFLIQTFENIEYGIQTIKFKNLSFQYKSYELGFLINQLILNNNYYNQLKIINLFNFSNYFIYFNLLYLNNNKCLNFYKPIKIKKWIKKKKNNLTLVKKNLRTIFYKKNKKFIRYLYLLNNKINLKLFVMKKSKNYIILKNFYKYINRLFKVHIFSSSLLIFSTYILNNPLIIGFNFLYNYLKFKLNIKYNILIKNKLILTLNKNFLIFKYNNILKYKLIWYNFKLTNNIYFFIHKKFFYKNNKIFSINNLNLILNYKKVNVNIINLSFIYFIFNKERKIEKNIHYNNQKKFFTKYYINNYKKKKKIQQFILNDYSFINRVSFYLAGKALILILLKKNINLKNLNLWLIKNKFEKNKIKKKKFIKQVIKKLITKEEFESYLLFLITGHISEIKFLLNNNIKNFSNISVNELKEIGWLLNFMINKTFFYNSINVELLKKVFIKNVKNSFKVNNKKIIKNKQNNTMLFEQKLIILKNKFDNYFLFKNKIFITLNYQKFSFWDSISYWWEPNVKIKNIHIMYWSFSKYKKFNLFKLVSKHSLKYNYYFNIINNKLKNNLNYKLKNNLHLIKINKKLDFNQNYYLNSNTFFNINLLIQFFKLEINWNYLVLIEYYILMSNIIFNLTNKIFNILDINIELLDYLIYYILCNERFYQFELEKMYSIYFNNKK